MCSNSFFSFMKEQEELLQNNGQFKTAVSYSCTFNSFFNFRKGEDLSIEEITSEQIKSYQSWLKQRGVVSNTSSFYMRVLRAVYNKAVSKNLAVQQHSFEGVYTGIDKTQKRALSIEALRLLKELDLSGKKKLELARDLFMFSFYTRGMAFVDMAHLCKKDIKDGLITYHRKKTGQQLIIGLEPCMEEIIEKYSSLTEGSDYVLPILHSNISRDLQEQYYNALRYQNAQLKKIEKLLNIPHLHLTTYVPRHTWASIARENGVSLSVISEGMGHASEKTTRIYLASLNQVIMDEANRKVLSSIK
ncbi:tyrosine-type recombinase/integrase [Phocaeicola faecalis]